MHGGTSWLEALESCGGRLVPAARTFVGSEHPSLPDRGSSGIRWLAEQMEAFVDRDTSDTDDHRFVEGAGALLGLLLIEHLGGEASEREGRHRVRLGRFGWFDPFGAIQDALDAEDPRACLAEYVTVAEQEASETGPVSKILRVFSDTLARQRPDLSISSCFELSVDLDNGAQVDLERLERVARDGDEAAIAEAASRLISMLPGGPTHDTIEWSDAADRVLPRLVSDAFLASLPTDQSLFTAPVGHDVHLALQLRYGGRARYVRRAEVDAWAAIATHAAEPSRQALANLRDRSSKLNIERAGEGVLRVRQGDGLDGARLLLGDLATRLARLGDGPWLAAVPHRDVLLFGPAGSADELASLADDAAQRAPHPISRALFELTADGPRPWPRS